MDFKKRTIVVQGEKIEIDLDESGLAIADLSIDMGKVASQMAWWASVLAAAEAEKIRVDAYYRRWRAQSAQAIVKTDPKLAEYKQKLALEADEAFVEWKDKIAISEENVILAKGMLQAFDKKGSMLQSRGAIARGELAATGMTTPAVPAATEPTRDWVSQGKEASEDALAASVKNQNGTRKTRSKALTSNGETEDKPAITRAVSHLRKLKLGITKAEVQEAS